MPPEDTEAGDDAGVIARSRREPSLFAVIFDRHALEDCRPTPASYAALFAAAAKVPGLTALDHVTDGARSRSCSSSTPPRTSTSARLTTR